MSPKTNGSKRLKVEPRSRMQKILLRWGWILPLGAIFVGGSILILTYAFASIPLPRDFNLTSSAEVYDVNGNLIGTFTDEVTRFLISEEDMEKLLKKKPFIGESVIAAEDRDFYEHNGVSLRGIARAAWANLTGGEVSAGWFDDHPAVHQERGAQRPRRVRSRERSKKRSSRSSSSARYSKKQILGFYLNTIYLGRGAYGIEAAVARLLRAREFGGTEAWRDGVPGRHHPGPRVVPDRRRPQARDRAARSRPGPDGARGLHHSGASREGEGQEAEARRVRGEHARREVPAGRVLHGVAQEELPLSEVRQRSLHARPQDLHDDRHEHAAGRRGRGHGEPRRAGRAGSRPRLDDDRRSDPGDGRRQGLRQRQEGARFQLRDGLPRPPAGFVVQAVHAPRRDRGRHLAAVSVLRFEPVHDRTIRCARPTERGRSRTTAAAPTGR